MPEKQDSEITFALSDVRLRSSAFDDRGDIPQKYTQDGAGISPPLAWDRVPGQTKSFVVFAHDPDAPCVSSDGSYGFAHWLVYNLSPSTAGLAEENELGTLGLNSRGNSEYMGPSPPSGHGIHEYYFWLVCLGAELNLDAGLTLSELLRAIKPHVIGMNRLVGCYQRR